MKAQSVFSVVRKQVLKQMRPIVHASKTRASMIHRMESMVDELARLECTKELMIFSQEDADDIKKELTPRFHAYYDKLHPMDVTLNLLLN